MATRWWYTQAGTIVGFLADDGKWFYKQSGETFGYIGGTLDLRGGRHADRLLRQCRLDLPATGRQSKTGFHLETSILEQLSAEHRQYMLQRIPLGRPGQPSEVAALIAWLASDEASFTTGQCIDISGGRATY